MGKNKFKSIIFTFMFFTLFIVAGNSWALTSLPTLDYTGTAASSESAGSVSLSLDTITTIDRANYINGNSTSVNNNEETIIDAVVSLTGAVNGDCSTASAGYFFFPAIATVTITGQDNFVYMTANLSYIPPGSNVLFIFDGTRWLLYPPTLDPTDPSLVNLSNIQTNTDATHPSRYINEIVTALSSNASDILGMTMILTPQPGSGSLCDGSPVSTFNVQGIIDGAPDTPSNIGPTAVAGVDGGVNVTCSASSCEVTLNGSGSSDPDDGIASYEWYDAGGTLIGTGVTLPWTLPIGVHQIQLIVTDVSGLSAEDIITVVIDPAELAFDEIDKTYVKRDGKIKISGRIALPAGLSHFDVNSIGRAILSLKTSGSLPEVPADITAIDEEVDFIERSNGNKWKYSSNTALGITKFSIDWKGSKFNYTNGPLSIKTDHIGETETELAITSCVPVTVNINGTIITIDANDNVSCSHSGAKIDGDDDGDSDDSDSDGGNSSDDDDDCTVGVRLPFALTPGMVIDISGSVTDQVTVTDGTNYTAAVGKFKLHGRFDVTDATGIDFTSLIPWLETTIILGNEGFSGTLIIDDATWTKIKSKYWKYKSH